jgi:hypothetical protein
VLHSLLLLLLLLLLLPTITYKKDCFTIETPEQTDGPGPACWCLVPAAWVERASRGPIEGTSNPCISARFRIRFQLAPGEIIHDSWLLNLRGISDTNPSKHCVLELFSTDSWTGPTSWYCCWSLALVDFFFLFYLPVD